MDVVLLLADVALDVVDQVLARLLVDRHHLLLDHVGQLLVVDVGVVADALGVVHVVEVVVRLLERRLSPGTLTGPYSK